MEESLLKDIWISPVVTEDTDDAPDGKRLASNGCWQFASAGNESFCDC